MMFYSTIIEVNNVFKTYKVEDINILNRSQRNYEVLKGIYFTVKKGEISGLVGLNGHGKTTTLKIIMGFLRPDSGEVTVFGESPYMKSVKKRVSFLPENPPIYEAVKVKDIMKFVANMRGCDSDGEIEAMFDIVELHHAKDKFVRSLSRGMMQRLGLAQAFLCRPELIILDEPLSGLDPLGRRMAKDLISKARNDGSTVLFTSHILGDIEEISDRVSFLFKGRIIKSVTKDEINGEHGLERLFLEAVSENVASD